MSGMIDEDEWDALIKRQLPPFTIVQNKTTHTKGQVRLSAVPTVTSKGRFMLTVEANVYLDRDEVLRLRNWLSDWLGHTETMTKPDWLDDNNIKAIKQGDK